MAKRIELIKGIQNVINGLEKGGIEYNPDISKLQSNFPILALELTGLSVWQVKELTGMPLPWGKRNVYIRWSAYIMEHCSSGNESEMSFFATLQSKGLTRDDMIALCYLSDPEVCKRAFREYTETVYPIKQKKILGIAYSVTSKTGEKVKKKVSLEEQRDDSYSYYENQENYLAYLKAWRELLEEET